MRDKIHAITHHHDIVVFIPTLDPDTMRIVGAERSMGEAWRTGTYSLMQSRALWKEIVAQGGVPVEDEVISAIISEAISPVRAALTAAQDALKQTIAAHGELASEAHALQKMLKASVTYGQDYMTDKPNRYYPYP